MRKLQLIFLSMLFAQLIFIAAFYWVADETNVFISQKSNYYMYLVYGTPVIMGIVFSFAIYSRRIKMAGLGDITNIENLMHKYRKIFIVSGAMLESNTLISALLYFATFDNRFLIYSLVSTGLFFTILPINKHFPDQFHVY